jgi:hypothetical protein
MYQFNLIILLKYWAQAGRDKLFLHNVALHSTSTSPTILVYDGAASTGESIAELASYQGVPPSMVLSLDWKIKDTGHDR